MPKGDGQLTGAFEVAYKPLCCCPVGLVICRYVQPDEFLVMAEALVQNLMLGICKAKEMGGSSLVGYLPDSFGHIAQMVPDFYSSLSIFLCGQGLVL